VNSSTARTDSATCNKQIEFVLLHIKMAMQCPMQTYCNFFMLRNYYIVYNNGV